MLVEKHHAEHRVIIDCLQSNNVGKNRRYTIVWRNKAKSVALISKMIIYAVNI